jgi:DNA-binding response OmpR family regulator
MKRRILVVEDDRTLRQALTFNLSREDYDVRVAVDGEQALAAARDQGLDLILLDIMLPGMSGLEVLRVIRGEGITTPVIVVSAKGDEIDRVVGLKVGADDYVAKPFSRPELLARIEAVLRRQRRADIQGDELGSTIRSGELAVDVPHREATFGGEPLQLTTKEFDLLRVLVQNAGSVVVRDTLMRDVWGSDPVGSTKTLDMHVSWLRRKLGDDANAPRYVSTVRGLGFRFEIGAS